MDQPCSHSNAAADLLLNALQTGPSAPPRRLPAALIVTHRNRLQRRPIKQAEGN
jgi:hypothetical protein